MSWSLLNYLLAASNLLKGALKLEGWTFDKEEAEVLNRLRCEPGLLKTHGRKKLQLKWENTIDYPEDAARIKQVLLDRGYEGTDHECALLWRLYSESFCAGWLQLPEIGEGGDSSIFNSIKQFIDDA